VNEPKNSNDAMNKLWILPVLLCLGCGENSHQARPVLYSGTFKDTTRFEISYQRAKSGSEDGYPMLQLPGKIPEELPKQGLYDASYEGKFSHRLLDNGRISLTGQREGHDACEYIIDREKGIVAFKLIE
jgi:hypothetical protein